MISVDVEENSAGKTPADPVGESVLMILDGRSRRQGIDAQDGQGCRGRGRGDSGKTWDGEETEQRRLGQCPRHDRHTGTTDALSHSSPSCAACNATGATTSKTWVSRTT